MEMAAQRQLGAPPPPMAFAAVNFTRDLLLFLRPPFPPTRFPSPGPRVFPTIRPPGLLQFHSFTHLLPSFRRCSLPRGGKKGKHIYGSTSQSPIHQNLLTASDQPKPTTWIIPLKMQSFSLPPFPLATILSMFFLICHLLLAIPAAPANVNEVAAAIPQQMEKRFYAWDEMSAKRSLIPARPELIEEVGILSEEPAEALPVVLKRVPNSKLAEWKRSLRQRRPKMLAKLFFGPTEAE